MSTSTSQARPVTMYTGLWLDDLTADYEKTQAELRRALEDEPEPGECL